MSDFDLSKTTGTEPPMQTPDEIASEADETIAQLRQRVTELEGQCAAMREALEMVRERCHGYVAAFATSHASGDPINQAVIRDGLAEMQSWSSQALKEAGVRDGE